MVKVRLLFGQVVNGEFRAKDTILSLPFAQASEGVRMNMMKRIA